MLLLMLLLVDLIPVAGLLLLFLLVGGQRAVDDRRVLAEHLDRQGVQALGGQGIGDFFQLVGGGQRVRNLLKHAAADAAPDPNEIGRFDQQTTVLSTSRMNVPSPDAREDPGSGATVFLGKGRSPWSRD